MPFSATSRARKQVMDDTPGARYPRVGRVLGEDLTGRLGHPSVPVNAQRCSQASQPPADKRHRTNHRANRR